MPHPSNPKSQQGQKALLNMFSKLHLNAISRIYFAETILTLLRSQALYFAFLNQVTFPPLLQLPQGSKHLQTFDHLAFFVFHISL